MDSNESLKITRLRIPIVCSGLFLEQTQAYIFFYICLIASADQVLIKYTIAQNVSKKNTFKTLCICQKPSMDRNCCSIVFFVYMSYSDTQKVAKCCVREKKLMIKKGGMGNRRQHSHRVLSTSTCDLEECLRSYAMCNICILLCLLVVASKPNNYFQTKLVNNYMYISIKFCICLLIQDQGYHKVTRLGLEEDRQKSYVPQCVLQHNCNYHKNLI